MTASTTAAEAANFRARMSRAVALWVLTLALPLGRQWLLHSKLPDTLPPTSALFGEPQSGVLTVGVAVTVTGCDASFPIDGAAVLKYSFLRHSSERYRYQFYAIHHPMAAKCVKTLEDVGYVLLERETPVNISAIEGEYLRGRIAKSGCCGEKELIKFEAFLLTQHPVVILMDMDMLVVKPLDDVIDLILYNNPHPEQTVHHLQNTSGHRNNTASGDVWLLYVSDYAMAQPYSSVIPSQGGFAIFKPNRTIYREIQQIVLKGEFHDTFGWGNATGVFWGSTTFQGLLPYYFQVLNPGHALELDWRIYNNMNSPRSDRLKRGEETIEYCFTPDCQDVRDTPFEDVFSVHFTNCQKPWKCLANSGDNPKTALCRAMHRAWFQYRSELEKSWGRPGRGSHNETNEHLRGYCSNYGEGGYEAIQQPYGVPV